MSGIHASYTPKAMILEGARPRAPGAGGRCLQDGPVRTAKPRERRARTRALQLFMPVAFKVSPASH